MNKKGQVIGMPSEPNKYTHVSPIMFLGIFIFILPFFKTVLKINFPGWLTGVGIIFILIGVIHSIIMR